LTTEVRELFLTSPLAPRGNVYPFVHPQGDTVQKNGEAKKKFHLQRTTSSPGDKIHPWGTNSPPGSKFAPGGEVKNGPQLIEDLLTEKLIACRTNLPNK
jgi:hypothetical protein